MTPAKQESYPTGRVKEAWKYLETSRGRLLVLALISTFLLTACGGEATTVAATPDVGTATITIDSSATVSPENDLALSPTVIQQSTQELPLSTETGGVFPTESWVTLPESSNILTNGGWERFNGVEVLPDGSLEFQALGGGSWNEVINRNVRIVRENGSDFSVSARFDLNPDYYHQGIILADSELKNTGVRVDVSFIDGSNGRKWAIVEYWNKNTSGPPRVLGNWVLADDEKLSYDMRLAFSGDTMTIIIDGENIGQVGTVDLLAHSSIFLGFRTSPDESLRVSDVSVMQRDSEQGIRVEMNPQGVPTAVFVSPTPGGVEVTPVPPPVVEATPSDGNPFAANASECIQLEDWGYKWHCFTGGSRSMGIETMYPGMVVYVYKAVPGGVAELLGKTDLNGLNNFSLTNPNYDYEVWDTGQIALVIHDWPPGQVFPIP